MRIYSFLGFEAQRQQQFLRLAPAIRFKSAPEKIGIAGFPLLSGLSGKISKYMNAENTNRYTVSRNVQVKLFSILVETKEAIAHLVQNCTAEFELNIRKTRNILWIYAIDIT